jgi:dipeptidyl aminopeptidase/acylaminoacyl peptidase
MSAKQDFGDGRVQQDIIDGMEYVLSQGIGDRQKLAMYGHSFGGFSTLAALAFTPNLFKVGIAGAPPTDLAQSVKMLGLKKKMTDNNSNK